MLSNTVDKITTERELKVPSFLSNERKSIQAKSHKTFGKDYTYNNSTLSTKQDYNFINFISILIMCVSLLYAVLIIKNLIVASGNDDITVNSFGLLTEKTNDTTLGEIPQLAEETFLEILSTDSLEAYSLNERLQIAQYIANELTEAGGLPYSLHVRTSTDLAEKVAASYSANAHVIKIKESYLSQDSLSAFSLLFTIAHEYTHAVQFAEIEFLDYTLEYNKKYVEMDFFKDLFKDTQTYKEELSHYLPVGTDGYSDQLLEQHANLYAEETVDYYRSLIKEVPTSTKDGSK